MAKLRFTWLQNQAHTQIPGGWVQRACDKIHLLPAEKPGAHGCLRAVGLSVPVGAPAIELEEGYPGPNHFQTPQELWVLSGPPGVEWVDLVSMFYMYRISFISVFWFCFYTT